MLVYCGSWILHLFMVRYRGSGSGTFLCSLRFAIAVECLEDTYISDELISSRTYLFFFLFPSLKRRIGAGNGSAMLREL